MLEIKNLHVKLEEEDKVILRGVDPVSYTHLDVYKRQRPNI